MKAIYEALVKAQAGFKSATFDSANPHFKSKYASLTSVMNAVRASLNANGLAITQNVDQGNVITTLVHISGESISNSVPLIVGKNDMQGMGSALTYGRRYGLSALLGIVTDEDDDGNGSQPNKPLDAPKEASTTSATEPPPHTDADFVPSPEDDIKEPNMGYAQSHEASPLCPVCGKKGFVSKFNDQEFYCTCKKPSTKWPRFIK